MSDRYKYFRSAGIAFFAAALFLNIVFGNGCELFVDALFIAGVVMLAVYYISLVFPNERTENGGRPLTDTGPEWNYYRLTHRRRMLRSLLPGCLFLGTAAACTSCGIRAAAVLWMCSAAFLLQAFCECRLWRKERKKAASAEKTAPQESGGRTNEKNTDDLRRNGI